MITKAQLQRHARQAGYNLAFFEVEVILTYLLEMLIERGIAQTKRLPLAGYGAASF
jgi:hypothetical protein